MRGFFIISMTALLAAYDQSGTALPLVQGTFTPVATANIAASPYAEITALADARRLAADDAADRIARDIAFKTKSPK